MKKLLLTPALAAALAACATAPSTPSPKLVTICMPCGNTCEYPCTPEAAKPTASATFDPAQGYFAEPTEVKLSSATPGAQIFYTTDGSEPSAKSTPYTGPIAVAQDTTIKAIAVAPNLPPSEVSSGVYNVAPPAPPPVAEPAPAPEPAPVAEAPAPAPTPRVTVTEKKLELGDKVFFDTGKATVKPESDSLLDEVASALQQHSEVQHVVIEGHTDATGGAARNKKLSQARADAVKSYLVSQGVDASRLEAKGYGQAKPIESNKTAKGREANRRVEFVIH